MRTHLIVGLLAAALLGGCSEAQQKQAEQDAKQGLEKAGKAVETTMDTAKLKSMLMASSKLDSSKIDVDKEGNTFYLRGSVPTTEEKERAFRLAQDSIPASDKVVDELKVEPAGTATP